MGQDFADAWMQGEGLAAYRRNLELMLFEKGKSKYFMNPIVKKVIKLSILLINSRNTTLFKIWFCNAFLLGIIPAKGTPSSLLQRFQSGNVDVDTMMDCAIIVEHMKRVLGGW